MKSTVKLIFRLALCICITFAASSCVTTVHSKGPAPKSIPPGQAKKMTGSQSAKPYAPGQQKKK